MPLLAVATVQLRRHMDGLSSAWCPSHIWWVVKGKLNLVCVSTSEVYLSQSRLYLCILHSICAIYVPHCLPLSNTWDTSLLVVPPAPSTLGQCFVLWCALWLYPVRMPCNLWACSWAVVCWLVELLFVDLLFSCCLLTCWAVVCWLGVELLFVGIWNVLPFTNISLVRFSQFMQAGAMAAGIYATNNAG